MYTVKHSLYLFSAGLKTARTNTKQAIPIGGTCAVTAFHSFTMLNLYIYLENKQKSKNNYR